MRKNLKFYKIEFIKENKHIIYALYFFYIWEKFPVVEFFLIFEYGHVTVSDFEMFKGAEDKIME